MAITKHVKHIRSSVADSIPTAEQLDYGEIAINYSTDNERLFIKNTNNDIVPFYSGKVIEENEQVTAAALADLDGRINDLADIAESMENITYSELKSKRDGAELVPGKFYRITDYVTTTVQENTQSANHQFDVVVLALDKYTLSENAHAMLHGGDTYFSTNKADLSAWELKYCLNNDTDRFGWTDSVNGKGVIYYMKDEWNNECPYDFKNIQFKRWAVTDVENAKLNESALNELKRTFKYDEQGNNFTTRYAFQSSEIYNGYTAFIVDANNYGWYYTFSTIKKENGSFDFSNIEDASIKGNNFYNDEDGGGCFGNIIKPYYNNMASEDDGIDGSQYLNNIVFNGYYETSDGGYAYHAFANSIGYNSSNNTFGFDFNNNTFGYYCKNNTVGNHAYDNTFGYNASDNCFGNGCYDNTFGNYAYGNTFSVYASNNTFGDACSVNIFGIACASNTFGRDASGNSFGDECTYNTFGNFFQYNTFGNFFQYNTFGNNVTYFNSENTGHIRWINVENMNSYITLVASPGTSQGTYLQNIKIAQGTNNATSESGRKTITHTTTNDEFVTTYQPANSVVVLK